MNNKGQTTANTPISGNRISNVDNIINISSLCYFTDVRILNFLPPPS